MLQTGRNLSNSDQGLSHINAKTEFITANYYENKDTVPCNI